ncbi:MAG: protein kinase [Gemmatimonadaceae bacterium]|jgi:alpha-tubulin suppressor-like RCC1 family protein/tRNA A-37 threonylcarbamoyl transferase component Bud32|nr:protein kinase [Gemmatimonadaceae bacterium]
MAEELDRQEVGDLEDEYELLGELGRGGSAVVFRARDRALGREVAIKVVRPRFAASADESLERLTREARTVARLEHPRIVRVYAVKRLRDGGLALVMQLIPGRTLKDTVLQDGPFDPARAEAVLRDVAEALAFAHANGVVHRDVKPENIFLEASTGRALLSDFGIAHSAEFDSRLTMTGAAIGTPTYMAPEQIDGAPANVRSDLYSLGLVGWEMLTGRRPWDGEPLYNVLHKQKHEALPAIDELRPNAVPPRLQYLVERMLQKKPAARFAGADGLLANLDHWVEPADFKQWEAAHRRRRETAKATPRATPASVASTAATVRFTRGVTPAGSAVATATPTPESRALPTTEPDIVDEPVEEVEEDATPSWMEELEPAPRRGRALLIGGAVTVLVGVALTVGAQRMGLFSMPPLLGARTPDATQPLPFDTAAPLLDSIAIANANALLADSIGAPLRDSLHADSARAGALVPPLVGVDSARADAPVTNVVPATRPPGERLATELPAGWQAPPATATRAATSATTSAPPAGAPTAAAPTSASTAPARVVEAAPVASIRVSEDPGIIAAGGRHSCALVDGQVLCWGANDRGQLGAGDGESRESAAPVNGELQFVQVSAGLAHSCGVTRDGDAYCWGADERGQLGDATTTSRSAPVRVSGTLTYRQVRTGLAHSCGLTVGGSVACWGANGNGQLGDGGAATRSAPVTVRADARFVALSTGWNHTCALAVDGSAWCWGANGSGQLGTGGREDARTPTPVLGGLRFTAIAAGGAHTCGVTETGDAFCWGKGNFGQLGTGSTGDQLEPAAVAGGTRFASVTAGGSHSCGRARGGQSFCWGRNVYGQLGDGTTTDRVTPARVVGVEFRAISATGAHSCGMASDGESWCWGFNTEGQLGDGTRNHRPRPVRIPMPGR